MARSEKRTPPPGERFRDFNEFYAALDATLRPIVQRYFDEQTQNFKAPPAAKIRSDFEGHRTLSESWITFSYDAGGRPADIREALKTVAVVRYIDDCIDDNIWAHIDLTVPDTYKRYCEMLGELLRASKTLEPSITESSFAIFRVEADLTAQPTQENFDERLYDYLYAKAYDVLLCYCQIHGYSADRLPAELLTMGIVDTFRDFREPRKGKVASTDFDLYEYMVSNRLDPQHFIRFVEGGLLYLNEDISERYEAGQSVDDMLAERPVGDGLILMMHGLDVLKAYAQTLE